jgi:hypothetical protein
LAAAFLLRARRTLLVAVLATVPAVVAEASALSFVVSGGRECGLSCPVVLSVAAQMLIVALVPAFVFWLSNHALQPTVPPSAGLPSQAPPARRG